jgi:hypothetical protein
MRLATAAGMRRVEAWEIETERQGTALLTADARIEQSGAPMACKIITITP